jgi:flavin-dependent dehydrogenase
MNTTPKRDSYDVVVIGAGPAGLAAAATATEAGLSTLLLDENAGPGGQVWRAIASTPVTEPDQLGADYWAGADLVQAARRAAPRSSSVRRSGASTAFSRYRHLGRWRRLSSRRGA